MEEYSFYEIEVPDFNDSFIDVELNGKVFFLEISWSSNPGGWSLSFFNEEEEILAYNIPLLESINLLDVYNLKGLPDGILYVDRLNEKAKLDRDAFQLKNFRLLYLYDTKK